MTRCWNSSCFRDHVKGASMFDINWTQVTPKRTDDKYYIWTTVLVRHTITNNRSFYNSYNVKPSSNLKSDLWVTLFNDRNVRFNVLRIYGSPQECIEEAFPEFRTLNARAESANEIFGISCTKTAWVNISNFNCPDSHLADGRRCPYSDMPKVTRSHQIQSPEAGKS